MTRLRTVRPRRRPAAATLVVLLGILALVLGVAAAALAAGVVDQAGQALRSDPVYVDPNAHGVLASGDADRLRQSVRDAGEPVFVAVVPASASQETGGAAGLPVAIGKAAGRPGVYVVASDQGVKAASEGGGLGRGQAQQIVNDAVSTGGGRLAVLQRVVAQEAAAERAGGGTSSGGGSDRAGSSSGSGGGGHTGLYVFLGLLAAAGVGGGLLYRRRQRRTRARDADAFARRRDDVRSAIDQLGNDLTAAGTVEPTVDTVLTTPTDRAFAQAWSRFQGATAGIGTAQSLPDVERAAGLGLQARAALQHGLRLRDGAPDEDAVLAEARRQGGPDPDQRLDRDPAGSPPYQPPTGQQQRGGTTTIDNRTTVNNYTTTSYPGYGYGFYPGAGYGYFGYGGSFVGGVLVAEMLGGFGGYGGFGWGGGGLGGYGGGWGGYDQGYDMGYDRGYDAGGDQGGGYDSAADVGGGGGGWGGGFDTGADVGGGDWGGGGGGGDWGGGGGGGGDGGGGGGW